MLRIAVCDDDLYIRQQIRDWLHVLADEMQILLELDFFADGSQLLQKNWKDQPYHILYLDVEMEELDGLQAAGKIREDDRQVLIIYISNHDRYAIAGYKVHPFHFLQKPLNESAFQEVFCQAYETVLKYKNDFVYNTGKKSIHLPIRDILYFQSNNKTVEAMLKDTKQEFLAKLDDLEWELEHSDYPFIRIHKSYLVSYIHIKEKYPDQVILSDDTKLPVSRKMRQQADHRYGNLVSLRKGH